jgi:hypothetical protein
LDTNFQNENNEINYNALVKYFDKREKELRKKLFLPFISFYSFFVMDDNFIPLEKNTYQKYLKRKIRFSHKSCYINMLNVLNSNMTTSFSLEKNILKTTTVCRKLGQGGGALLQEFGEDIENGDAGAIALLIFLIIIFSFFLFTAGLYLGVVETDISYTEFLWYILKGIFRSLFG